VRRKLSGCRRALFPTRVASYVFKRGLRPLACADAGALADRDVGEQTRRRAAPNDPTNLNALAWVDVVLGKFADARALADRAVSMAPDAGAFHGTRCFALVGLDEPKEARAECARAAALLPENLTYLGMMAFLDHRYDEARRAWERASQEPSTARELGPWVARLPGPKG
jgi:Flp pilus assembly protein TadD